MKNENGELAAEISQLRHQALKADKETRNRISDKIRSNFSKIRMNLELTEIAYDNPKRQ